MGHERVRGGVADAGTECSTMMAALSGRLPWLTALVLPQRHLEIPQRKRLSHTEPPRRDQQCLLLNAVCGCSKRILCSHGHSQPASTNTHARTRMAPHNHHYYLCAWAGVFCERRELSRGKKKKKSVFFWNGCDFGTKSPGWCGLLWIIVVCLFVFSLLLFFFFLGRWLNFISLGPKSPKRPDSQMSQRLFHEIQWLHKKGMVGFLGWWGGFVWGGMKKGCREIKAWVFVCVRVCVIASGQCVNTGEGSLGKMSPSLSTLFDKLSSG